MQKSANTPGSHGPLILQYQSRIVKARRHAVGGLRLLGIGMGIIFSAILVMLILVILDDPKPGRVGGLMGVGLAILVGLVACVVMVICAFHIKRNRMFYAYVARFAVPFLLVPIGLVIYSHFADLIRYEADWMVLGLTALLYAALLGGLVAVEVELTIIFRAFRRGDFDELVQ